MANLWDELDNAERRAVAKQMIVGSENTQENLNRAMEQLAQNPKLVARYADEAGIEVQDSELEDTEPTGEQDNENDIERNVNEALADEPNVQETGELTQDIPPPMRGESMQDYIARLTEMGIEDVEGGRYRKTRQRPAGQETVREDDTESYEDLA